MSVLEKWVLYKELVEKINLEDIQYGFFIGEANKGHYIFIEEWIELKVLGAYCRSEHFVRIVPQLDQLAKKLSEAISLRLF